MWKDVWIQTVHPRLLAGWARTKFAASRAIAIAGYKSRERKRSLKYAPRLWLTPGELLHRDLELFVGEEKGASFFEKSTIDRFAQTRDEILSKTYRQIIIAFLLLSFLLSDYLSLGVQLNVGGFTLRHFPGLRETLLVFSSLLSLYTVYLQANLYIIESTMKFAIRRVFPTEVLNVYLALYFPHENYGRYYASNLPRITPTSINSKVNIFGAYLILGAPVMLAGFGVNTLLIVDLWMHPALGVWSRIICIYIVLCSICTFLFLISTRLRLPYRDWIINQELEGLEQVAPDRAAARRDEIFRESNQDYAEMIRRGFLEPPEKPPSTAE